jgi:hypothetical protein
LEKEIQSDFEFFSLGRDVSTCYHLGLAYSLVDKVESSQYSIKTSLDIHYPRQVVVANFPFIARRRLFFLLDRQIDGSREHQGAELLYGAKAKRIFSIQFLFHVHAH